MLSLIGDENRGLWRFFGRFARVEFKTNCKSLI